MKRSNYFPALLIFLAVSNIPILPDSAFARTGQASSAEIIAQAYQSKLIDRQTYLVQTLKSYFCPTQVASPYRSSVKNAPTRDITPLLDEARDRYDSFSRTDRAFLDRLFKRPTDPLFEYDKTNFHLPAPVTVYEPTPEQYPFIGNKLKFWYVSHNIADASSHIHETSESFVVGMASVFDYVWKTEIEEMEYLPPLSDPGGAAYGGDEKFDVYILNCGNFSTYGYVCRENTPAARESRLRTQATQSNRNAPLQERQGKNGYYCFMVMDNDYEEFATPTQTAEQSMQVTAAHEFFHTIQNGINAKAFAWFKETSSTWMEDQVYDAVDDNRQYVNGVNANDFFFNPQIPLDKATSHWYGAWIWNEYLSTKWDRDTIRAIWEELDPQGQNDPLAATIAILKNQKGYTVEETFLDFAVKNYVQTGFYRDAAFYDEVGIINQPEPYVLDFRGANTHRVSSQWTKINHLSSKYFIVQPSQAIDTPSSLTIDVKSPETSKGRIAAVVKKTDGQSIQYPIELDAATGQGTVDIVDFSTANIRDVVLVLANASTSKEDDNARFYYSMELKKNVFPTPTPLPYRPEIVFSGNITRKVTWSKQVHVNGAVSIFSNDNKPSTARLTILPGAIIRVTLGGLDVYDKGELCIKGSENKPVLFTSLQTEKQTGQWGIVRIRDTAKAAIENCTLEYGGGIELANSHKLKNVVVHHSQKGVSCSGNLEIIGCKSNFGESDGFLAANDLNATNSEAIGNQFSGFEAPQIYADGCLSESNNLCGYQTNTLIADRCIARNNRFNGFYISSGMIVTNCLAEDHNPGNGFMCSGTIVAASCVAQRNIFGFYGSVIDAEYCAILYNERGIESYPTELQPHTLISLRNSLVLGNSMGGLYLNDVGEKGITRNIIMENDFGIKFSNSSGPQSNVFLNDIHGNRYYEIFNFTPYRVTANENYWGDPTTTELKNRVIKLTKFYDMYKNHSMGSVTINSYYAQPVAETGSGELLVAYPTNTPTPTKQPVTPSPTPTVTPTSTPYPEGFPTPTPTHTPIPPTPSQTPIPPTPTPTLNPVSLYLTDSSDTQEDLSGWKDYDSASNRQLVIRWPALQTLSSIKTFDLYVSIDGGEFAKMNSVYSIAKYFKWWPVNKKAEEGPQFGHTYKFQVIVVLTDGTTVGPFTHSGSIQYLEGEDQPRPTPTPGSA